MSNIRLALVLSTGHVTEETARLLDAIPVSAWEKELGVTGGRYGEYGWFVYCSPRNDGDRIAADLFSVMQFAIAKGCEHILFDRDEPFEPELPRYDW